MAALFPLSISAQNAVDTESDEQLWPDVQITVRLNEPWSLGFFGTARLGRNWSAFTNEQIGIGVTRRWGANLSASLWYRHLHSDPAPGRHIDENRLFLDVTPRRELKWGLILQDRNRFEWRRIRGQTSYRYRNRVQFERPFNLGEKRLTPYLAVEPFYDTRFRTWSRTQAFLGMRIPLHKHVTFDGFYMHQWDSRVPPRHINVLGVFWRQEF